MVNGPKISAIIPVYNTVAYLPRCLDSILNSTYKNLELLCINDGSTDESPAIIERYTAADSRIIVINKANGGLSSARNAGLAVATGDFIALIDSDDWIHPQYFEILMQYSCSNHVDIVAGNYMRVSQCESAVQPYVTYISDALPCKVLSFDWAVKTDFLKRYVWGRLYAKESIGQLRFDEAFSWSEDTTFNLSLLLRNTNGRFAWIDVPLFFYFNRNTSISNTISFDSRIHLPKCYLINSSKFTDSSVKKYMLEQACKDTSSAYYAEMFNPEKKEVASICKNIITDCLDVVKASSMFSATELLKYRILFTFPFVYRLIRIFGDRTLLAWEKERCIRQRINI